MLRKKGVLGEEDMKSLGEQPRTVAVAPADASTAMAARAAAPPPVYRKAGLTVGAFDITKIGFVSFMTINRSTNTGNPAGTSYGTIPFDNTVAGNIGETRLTATESRLGLRAHAAVNSWLDVIGYFEGYFLGNDPANVFVSTNSHTFRERIAYADINAGQFELTAGQVWGWLVPNRKGLGPDPRNIFLTLNVDPNYNVGLPATRAAAAHVAWHPSQEFAIGVGVENPEQFTNGEVTFPNAFNTQLGGQLDNGANPGTPNPAPDVVGRRHLTPTSTCSTSTSKPLACGVSSR